MRGGDAKTIYSAFESAFNEDPKVALRTLFWARDVRERAQVSVVLFESVCGALPLVAQKLFRRKSSR